MSVDALTFPEFSRLSLPNQVKYLQLLESLGAHAHRRHLAEAQPHWDLQTLELHLQSIRKTLPRPTQNDLYAMLARMEL